MMKKIFICLLIACVLIAGMLVLSSCNEEHTHKIVKVDALEATCAFEGNTEYYMCECGVYFSDAKATVEIEEDSWVLPLLAHSPKKVAATEPTCALEGNTEYYECSCGKYFADKKATKEIKENSWVLETVSHSLTKVDTVNATCEAMGNTGYYKCDCGKYFSDADAKKEIAENAWVITATGHALVKVEATDATCDEVGNTEYYACSCGKYFADDKAENVIEKDSWKIAAIGHSPVKHEAADATCLEAGNTEYYECKCGKFFSDDKAENEIKKDSWVVAAHGHDVRIVRAADPTCVKLGNTKYYECRNCDKFFSDIDGKNLLKQNSWLIPMIPHTFNKVEATDPTCVDEGNEEYYYCDCGAFFSEKDNPESKIEEISWIVPANGHEPTKTDAVAPTCEDEGNTEYYTCHCGLHFSDEEAENEIEEDSWILAAIDHDYEDAEFYDSNELYVKKQVCANDATHVIDNIPVSIAPEDFSSIVNDPDFVSDPTSTATDRSWADYFLSLNGDYAQIKLAHAGLVELIEEKEASNGFNYPYYRFNRVINNFVIDGNNEATVAGISISASDTTTVSKNGSFKYYAEENITIDTLVIKNVTLTNKIYISGNVKITNLVIDNVTFAFDGGQAALHIISEDQLAENVTVSGCNFEAVEGGQHMFLYDTRTEDDVNITVEDCVFADFSNNAVQLSGSGSVYTGTIVLNNNKVTNAGDRPFRVSNLGDGAELIITGNVMVNSSDDDGEMAKVSAKPDGATITVSGNYWDAKGELTAVAGVVVSGGENVLDDAPLTEIPA